MYHCKNTPLEKDSTHYCKVHVHAIFVCMLHDMQHDGSNNQPKILENKSLTRYTYIQLKDIFPLAVVRFDYK